MPKLTQMFEILSKARELIAKCDISEPPVDLAKLATRQQIREIRVDDSVLNGDLRRLKSGGYAVRLDARDSEERRRFTLAHEIAHTFLHSRGSDATLACGNADIEDLCDLAAAEMLIPDALLRRRKFAMDIQSVLEIAREFRCSLEAGAWKLLNCADHKGALLIWKIRRIPPSVVAHLVAMPRTLNLQLPFIRGATISESDSNWFSVAMSTSESVELHSYAGVSYMAERKPLGRSTIAILIRLSKTDSSIKKNGERQGLLFADAIQPSAAETEKNPTRRRLAGATHRSS